MNQLIPISTVTKDFGISARTLRYYEEIGLLHSTRTTDYAYRMYDEEAVVRLRQVVVLRKLRIPLKSMPGILESGEAAGLLHLFQENIAALTDEITALETIRDILRRLTEQIEGSARLKLETLLFDDVLVLDVINSLSAGKISFKEEKNMEDLNKANQALNTLKNVRIIYLPPATVAAAHFVGENPEDTVSRQINDFIQSANLWERYPSSRHFGFNHPNPVEMGQPYGYEMWVTIPPDLEVPAPLQKKEMPGGMYAAHAIRFGNFHEWGRLDEWVRTNGVYGCNGSGSPEDMFGSLEESLNYLYLLQHPPAEFSERQLDLLIPVRKL